MRTIIFVFLFLMSIGTQAREKSKERIEVFKRASLEQIGSILQIVSDPEWREILKVKTELNEDEEKTTFNLTEVGGVKVLVKIVISKTETYLSVSVQGKNASGTMVDKGIDGVLDRVEIKKDGGDIIIDADSDLTLRIKFQEKYWQTIARILQLILRRPKELEKDLESIQNQLKRLEFFY